MSEAKQQKEIKFVNVTKQQHIDVNILRTTVAEVLEVERDNQEELEKAIAKHTQAKLWLELAEKNFKSQSKAFYEEIRKTQLDQTEAQIKSWEKQLEVQIARVKEIETFLDEFDSKVITDIQDDVVTFTYDWQGLRPLVELARIFNLGKNF